MIRLLYGENSFLIDRAFKKVATAAEAVEIIDGSELTAAGIADALGGMSLFAPNRTVIIKQLSDNTGLWSEAASFFERAQDADVVLIEASVDKRTKTYKWLKKHAAVQEYTLLPEYDHHQHTAWLESEAKAMKLEITSHQARRVYERVGGDQWDLYHALEKIALLPEINDQAIDEVIEPHLNENVFTLLQTCLNKDLSGVQRILTGLRQTDDPYRVFGLLSGQVVQLAALVYGSNLSLSQVAKDLGISSYGLGNLAPYAARLTAGDMRQLAEAFAHTDDRMKRSDADIWTLIENLLATVASK